MRRFSSLIIFASLVAISFTQTAAAAAPFSDACSIKGTANSSVCGQADNKTNPLVGPNGVLINVTHIVAIIAGAVAVVIIIVAAFRFISSQGEADKTAQARQTIIGAVIGLVIIVLAQALITYVLGTVLK